jgi:acetyl-CoA acetyltransferase
MPVSHRAMKTAPNRRAPQHCPESEEAGERRVSINGTAYVAGAFEHPTRLAADRSVAQLHAEVAKGALEDAGLAKDDVDGYFCSGDAPGMGPMSMVEYLGLRPRHVDATDLGGASYVAHVGHAAQAIAAGKCNVALITLAGRPRSEGTATGTTPRMRNLDTPDLQWEYPYGIANVNGYAMCAMRHMHEFGTTSEQLAWIKVAASRHAQHNPHALLRKALTVEDVLASPMVADPLCRLDCCVITDGGGALIVARPEVARSLKRDSRLRTSSTPRSTTASPSPSSSSWRTSASARPGKAAPSWRTATSSRAWGSSLSIPMAAGSAATTPPTAAA